MPAAWPTMTASAEDPYLVNEIAFFQNLSFQFAAKISMQRGLLFDCH
jgi:hypothetical protein